MKLKLTQINRFCPWNAHIAYKHRRRLRYTTLNYNCEYISAVKALNAMNITNFCAASIRLYKDNSISSEEIVDITNEIKLRSNNFSIVLKCYVL